MNASLSPSRNHPVGWIAAFTALSWLGEIIHNRIELPGLSPLSPENSLLALIAIALFLAWWLLPTSRAPTFLLLGLGLIHLIGGGILSVLPLKFLPYAPEQSPGHYLTHVVYGAAQLQLIIAMIWQIVQAPSRRSMSLNKF